MPRRGSRQVTIREGTSEKHWYTLSGYLAVVTLGFGFSIYTGLNAGVAESSPTGLFGTVLGLVVVVAALFGLAVYPAIFKDSAYVKGTRQWRPSWTRYLGLGIGVPVVAVLAAPFLGFGPLMGVSLGFLIHSITAPATATLYLYRRHRFVGTP